VVEFIQWYKKQGFFSYLWLFSATSAAGMYASVWVLTLIHSCRHWCSTFFWG